MRRAVELYLQTCAKRSSSIQGGPLAAEARGPRAARASSTPARPRTSPEDLGRGLARRTHQSIPCPAVYRVAGLPSHAQRISQAAPPRCDGGAAAAGGGLLKTFIYGARRGTRPPPARGRAACPRRRRATRCPPPAETNKAHSNPLGQRQAPLS